MANQYRLRFLKEHELKSSTGDPVRVRPGEEMDVSEEEAPDLVRRRIAVVSSVKTTGANQAVLSPSEVRQK